MNILDVQKLHVSVEGKEVLKGVDLSIKEGEVHALMGKNGSGKSTLSFAIMGHPSYKVESGKILYKGEDIVEMKVFDRARKGIFLAFQYPSSITGVSVANFIRSAYLAVHPGANFAQFNELLQENLRMLHIDEQFIHRYVNDGFSGGEKKKLEILQLAMLQPDLALLDETDSGLDIDALRIVSEGVNEVKKKNPQMSILLVTHYQRILNYITPDSVEIMHEGKIIAHGSADLALQLENEGYEKLIKEHDAKKTR
jgi:Fe-S cluster assembly ATP-binding protein